MHKYFKKMDVLGKPVKEKLKERTRENADELARAEAEIRAAKEKTAEFGLPAEKINSRGQLTIWQRLEILVDKGTWRPLHTLYNPADNHDCTTNVVDGLAQINGRWAVVIGFDNKYLAVQMSFIVVMKTW